MVFSLRREIEVAIDEGHTDFITGMARGVDIWAAEVVLEMRESGMPVRLICTSPYAGFEKNWSEEWQYRYSTVLDKADLVLFICKRYSRSCFQIRNEWMVDHANRVIAVFNGEKGGTKNTIEYARARAVAISEIRIDKNSY